jgi:hypothetical protein
VLVGVHGEVRVSELSAANETLMCGHELRCWTTYKSPYEIEYLRSNHLGSAILIVTHMMQVDAV